MEITKEKAIEIYELVANDSYVCEISSLDGFNRENSVGNGSDMIAAIEGGEYSEYYLVGAEKEDAVAAYNDRLEAGEINGEGYDTYDYHMLTIVSGSVMEISYIPVGGW